METTITGLYVFGFRVQQPNLPSTLQSAGRDLNVLEVARSVDEASCISIQEDEIADVRASGTLNPKHL